MLKKKSFKSDFSDKRRLKVFNATKNLMFRLSIAFIKYSLCILKKMKFGCIFSTLQEFLIEKKFVQNRDT